MKNLLVFTILFFALNVNAQNYKQLLNQIEDKWTLEDNGSVSYMTIIECDSMSKEEIYDKVRSYFTYNYGHANAVVQIDNPDAGLIVGKGIFPEVFTQMNIMITTTDVSHVLRVDIKNGKVRVIITLQEYITEIIAADGDSSSSKMWLSQAYPVNISGSRKNYYGKLFYKAYLRSQDTFKDIEKAIMEGNTSFDNSDW